MKKIGKGEEYSLGVSGIYSDGIRRDISSITTGTKYISSDPDILFIDDDAVMKAKSIGKAKIIVSNDGVSAELEVLVEPTK